MHHRAAFTLINTLFAVICSALALVMIIPLTGFIRGQDGIDGSIANLTTIAEAHFMYAGDFNGRQWTMTPDNLSTLISAYQNNYNEDIIPRRSSASIAMART